MLILLPPSEKKREPKGGGKFRLDTLSFQEELTFSRLSVLKRYENDINLEEISPAIDIYSGVLYQALDFRSLSQSAQRRAQSQLIIFSALFGALRPEDLIPRYSLKIKSSDWKLPLKAALDNLERELIVDCRSSTYASAWRSDPAITVSVRVFQVRAGVRSVITHMSKKYRGELTRILVQSQAPKNPHELRNIAAKFFHVELSEPSGALPWQLDLIISG